VNSFKVQKTDWRKTHTKTKKYIGYVNWILHYNFIYLFILSSVIFPTSPNEGGIFSSVIIYERISGEYLLKFCTNQIPSRKTRVVPFKAPESEVMLSTQSADVDLWPAKACEQKRSPIFFQLFYSNQQSLHVGRNFKLLKKFENTYGIQDIWNQFSSSEIFNVNLSWVQS